MWIADTVATAKKRSQVVESALGPFMWTTNDGAVTVFEIDRARHVSGDER